MMYLSRVKLNAKIRKTQIALANPRMFHGAIEHSFPSKQKRNLWRIDKIQDAYYLLVVSEEIPDLKNLVSQFGFEDELAQTKEYSPFMDKIESESLWRFRLVANPTHSVNQGNRRGKVNAHISETYQMEWVNKKAELHGFEIVGDSCRITGNEWIRFGRSDVKGKVTLLQVAYEGVLKVKDVEKFKKCLIKGVGRGKAYGSGLLTIARI